MNKLSPTVEPLFISKVMLNELITPRKDDALSHPMQNESVAGSPNLIVSKALTYNDMVKSITGSTCIDNIWLMQEVNKTLTMRRAYQALLKTLSFSHSGQQIAASSDEEFSARSNEYFKVDFKRDTTFKEQVYVLLSIMNPLARHLNTPIELHIIHEDNIAKLNFSALVEGKSQQLLDINDQLMKSLVSSESELFIY